ncbi:MAG TPA: M14 family zinc carboxypeptidase [Actinomycetota bacterium]|nr:M14 family zinc carboxypeptidase [Actinomycetota bacterium]
MPTPTTFRKPWLPLAATIALAATVAVATPASAQPGPPWNGEPISAGLGPTYSEPWCAPPAPGSSIANQQEYDGVPFQDTLALIPQEAIACTLDAIIADDAGTGPPRMSYSVIGQSAGGRDLYGVVVNALETPEQQRDSDRWFQLRSIMETDPTQGQDLLAQWGGEVKIPIFIEANIHGGEEEGTDAMMQALRDLVTAPYGTSPEVDAVLDHAILIVIPSQNPDGRFLGTRQNANGFDMNRDLFVQSQSEMRANVALQLEWLAPVMLAMHGYVNPTLIDGLTKPHNPGLEYDLFLKWNHLRLDANEAALAAVEQGITRPVDDFGPNGDAQADIESDGATQTGTTVTITTDDPHGLLVGQEVEIAGVGEWGYNGTFTITTVPTPTTFTYEATTSGLPNSGFGVVFIGNPAIAEGWDDWGPFYTQTYGAFFGVDGSTLEMCSNQVCGGRFGSKRAQYLGFYSSALFWIDNRNEILHDQLEIFRRGVTSAARPDCCGDPVIAGLGFTEDEHNWMVDYPQAFVIPEGGSPGGHPLAFEDGQRSPAEANRLAQWLLDNGIQLHRTTQSYAYGEQTIPRHSYVVFMDQPLRGIAYTALSAGQDISERITQLYAPPGAWSHGQLWGADTIEVPADDTFAPKVEPITSLNPLQGGLRGGGPANWYALTLRGAAEVRAVLDVLRSDVDGEVAEVSFSSASAGAMPAGSLLFENTPANASALATAGLSAGVYFERVSNASKPAQTTQLDEAPKIAILAGSTARTDTLWSLEQIFGSDAQVVTTASLGSAPADPLGNFDVIYNAGQNWPGNLTAQARLTAFFAGGGGYIGTSQSGNNFTFLVNATLVDAFAQANVGNADGGIAIWNNVGGIASPLTGGFPAQDFLYVPDNINYFTAVPTDASIDGRFLAGASSGPNGPTPLFVAGLWRGRDVGAAVNVPDAPIAVHGLTSADSRYFGLSTNPFSRGDAEREWVLIGQAALWSNLTDD